MSGVKGWGCVGKPRVSWQKYAVHKVTESEEDLFCRPGPVQALRSLWGQKLCMPWLPHAKQKCVPAEPHLRGSGKEGAIGIPTS